MVDPNNEILLPLKDFLLFSNNFNDFIKILSKIIYLKKINNDMRTNFLIKFNYHLNYDITKTIFAQNDCCYKKLQNVA